MRMKFFRIFPETCASTWCLFSSSTRNMALGSGSRTTAMTSIASSLLIRSLHIFRSLAQTARDFDSGLRLRSHPPDSSTYFVKSLRQNDRTVFGDRDTMFKVRAETSVRGDRCPLVAQHSRLGLPVIHHRFDRDHHAFAQPRAVTPSSEIRNLRLFVQTGTDAVSNKLTHYTKPGGFDMFLHCRAHISNRVADARLLNPAV